MDFHVHVDGNTEIRPFHPDDAEELYQLIRANEDHLYPWMGWMPEDGYTREDTRDFLRRSAKAAREQLSFSAAIILAGRIVGSTGFPAIDWANRIAQIGYWLGREHTGHGLMTAAARSLTAYAFDALEMNRIEIRCAVQNTASAAVAERLGFTREATLRQVIRIRDAFADEYIFSMLREDWETAGPAA